MERIAVRLANAISRVSLQHPKSAKIRRKFLVVEGIYFNTGEMCPMERMVELKRKYKLRLFIDESISFGTLGDHGRGITEHKNISVKLFNGKSKTN